MARKSSTPSSTPRLSEYARSFVFPSTIRKTVWPRVEAKGRELGLGFDWWQQQLGTVCLGYDENGKYAATVGGIGLSIPRQVGKTYFVLAMLLILCIIFPGLQVVWTAHHLRTSTKTFTTLRGMCRRKKVAPLIKAMRAANGEQQVEFINGSTIMFGARSQGFGRGFDEIDVEVFDEAQILDTKALEDMIAATNQARNVHGALLFFMGTPPRPHDPSEPFTARRAKARSGAAPNAVWLEIGADPKSDPDDRVQWPLMNPSFPMRTPLESMERLRENLSDPDSWNREGRGVWDEVSEMGTIFPNWEAGSERSLNLVLRRPDGRVHVGLAMDANREWTSIVWGWREGERIATDLVRREGSDWALPYLVERIERIQSVTVARGGPAGTLLKALVAANLPVNDLDFPGEKTAHGDLVDVVKYGKFIHRSHPETDTAAQMVKWRETEGGNVFSRSKSGAPIDPLEATANAVSGVLHQSVPSEPSVIFL